MLIRPQRVVKCFSRLRNGRQGALHAGHSTGSLSFLLVFLDIHISKTFVQENESYRKHDFNIIKDKLSSESNLYKDLLLL